MLFYLFCLNSHFRDAIMKKIAGTPTNFALENQAIKRQKLDGGRSRQVSHYCFLASPLLLLFLLSFIWTVLFPVCFSKKSQILNVKPQILPHKSKLGLANNSSSLCTSTAKTRRDERKVCYFPQPFFIFNSLASHFSLKLAYFEGLCSRTGTSCTICLNGWDDAEV